MSEKENKNEIKTGLESEKKEKTEKDKGLHSSIQNKNMSSVEHGLENSGKTISKVAETKKVLDNSTKTKKESKKVNQGSSEKTSKVKTKNENKDFTKNPKSSDNIENKGQKKVNENSSKNQKQSNEENNEFVEKLVSINRVAKVVKGGRRFSFAALVVVGDGNGMVGHGKGKAKEVPEAIKKASDEAKLNMLRVPLRQGRTLHHDISGRFDSGRVYLRSAPSGTGVIAGGPMRAVFEALGIQDIVAKSVGSSNPHNMIRATFEALKMVSSPKIIASRRGLKINDITKRRKSLSTSHNGAQDG